MQHLVKGWFDNGYVQTYCGIMINDKDTRADKDAEKCPKCLSRQPSVWVIEV